MNLQKLYQKVGGDFNEIKGRLPTEKLIEKFVLMLPNDSCYPQLIESMEKQDWQSAFTASHTLKGVAANLALKTLFKSASALTEDLRSGIPAATTQENFEQVKKDFDLFLQALKEEGAIC